jgi:hypothetical protein
MKSYLSEEPLKELDAPSRGTESGVLRPTTHPFMLPFCTMLTFGILI